MTRLDVAAATTQTWAGLDDAEMAEWLRIHPGDIDTVVLTDALPPLADIIEFLDGTDPDTWWAGPTFRGTRDGKTCHCALSHVVEKWGVKAFDEFESRYSTSYVIGVTVNDKATEKYPQAEPKDRVVAFLKDILAGTELTTHESMNAEGLASDRAHAERTSNV